MEAEAEDRIDSSLGREAEEKHSSGKKLYNTVFNFTVLGLMVWALYNQTVQWYLYLITAIFGLFLLIFTLKDIQFYLQTTRRKVALVNRFLIFVMLVTGLVLPQYAYYSTLVLIVLHIYQTYDYIRKDYFEPAGS